MKKILYTVSIVALSFIAFAVADILVIPQVRAHQKKQFLIVADNVQAQSAKHALIELIVNDIKKNNPNIDVNVVDLSALNLPMLTASTSPAQAPIADEAVKRWAELVNSAQAIIFMVPNYHRGYPAIFKNCIDLIWEPWHTKPVAVFGYSLADEDGANFIDSFNNLLSIIKTERIGSVYVPNLNNQLNAQTHEKIDRVLDQLIDASNQSNYLKKIKNAITSKLLRFILKMTNRKK